MILRIPPVFFYSFFFCIRFLLFNSLSTFPMVSQPGPFQIALYGVLRFRYSRRLTPTRKKKEPVDPWACLRRSAARITDEQGVLDKYIGTHRSPQFHRILYRRRQSSLQKNEGCRNITSAKGFESSVIQLRTKGTLKIGYDGVISRVITHNEGKKVSYN